MKAIDVEKLERDIKDHVVRIKDIGCTVSYRNGANSSIAVIENQPTFDLPEWIPVTERLPEEELEQAIKERGINSVYPVLVTCKKKQKETGKEYEGIEKAYFSFLPSEPTFFNADMNVVEVIAWQPLPKLYKPEGEKA